VKSKVQSMLIIFLDIKGISHKEFVLTDQTINSAHYSDHLRRLQENVRILRPEIWRQNNWLLHQHNTLGMEPAIFRFVAVPQPTALLISNVKAILSVSILFITSS
jgi:hypothetical protein